MPKACSHPACSFPIFGGGYCKSHQYLRTDRKPPKISTRSPIKQISKKQAKLNNEYSKLREEFLVTHPLCVARLLDCTGIATDVHHTQGRGVFFLKQETWLPFCRSCHQWVETHPDEAKKLNLSQSRLNN